MTCPICGTDFTPRPNQKYCSSACRVKAKNDPILIRKREVARNVRNMQNFRKFLGRDWKNSVI
jgi:hypothetical protein